MSRLMSVSLTEAAVRDRSKTVTRRLGWKFLKPGDRLTLCRKVMGRKPGEPLERITNEDVHREGVPVEKWGDGHAETCDECQPIAWAEWYARSMGCTYSTEVTRIEWRYLG